MLRINYLSLIKSYFYSHLPTHIVLFVTSRCNANCKICFYWERLNKPSNELSLSEIRKIFKSFGYVFYLVISGGEPFLRDDLDHICYILYSNNGTRFIHIPTNGMFPGKIETITESILKLCPKATISVELSLDGIGEVHDNIRGVNGAFEKINETSGSLLKLKNKYKNLWTKVNITFCYYNQDQIEDIYKYVNETMKTDDVTISLLWGNPKDPCAKNFSLDKYINSITMLNTEANLKSRGLMGKLFLSVKMAAKKEFLNAVINKRLNSPCRALKRIIVIDEQGDVYPCSMISEEIGSLRESDYDIKKILYSKRRFEIEKKYKIGSACVCNWDCAIFDNIIYDWRNYPRLIKYFLEHSR